MTAVNPPEPWEARSALRYGSQHEGYFANEAAARAYAERAIAAAGGVGRIEAVVDRVIYFDRYPELS